MVICSIGALWSPCAEAYRFGDSLTQTGPEEIVFNWSRDQCEPDGIPDLAARAFRDASNNVHLLLQHWITHEFVGPSLNSVSLSCNLVMASSDNADPSAYADREWIASPYTLDGTNVYALMHEEYLGRQHPGMCTSPPTQFANCRLTAVTFGSSSNGGATFTRASPAYLAATFPYRYVADVPTYGYSNPSGIVKRPDGYYYALVEATAYQQQQGGACLMRTRNLADPTSWRAWGGADFNIQFIDPYTSSADPAQHVCQPVDNGNISGMTDSLTFNTWLGQYMLVGSSNAYDPALGRDVYGFYYSTSTDLIHWSMRTLLMEAVLPWSYTGCGDNDPVQYPSVLDPNSPTRNFETTGRTMYLYFVRDHYNQYCNQDSNRDLVRIPVAFPNESPPGPGYPRPRGAPQMRIPLVPSYKPCASSNSTHGPPLSFPSCAPPVQRSSYLTLGTSDANGPRANGVGFLQLNAILGNPTTTANEADVKLAASVTDVRNKTDLSDYTGDLLTTLKLRLTDRQNADAPSRSAATTTDLSFSFTVPCQATPETDRGSACSLHTTANTVLPGAVVESKRTIWNVERILVFDGGPDSTAATQNGNTVFETPGLFVP